MQSVTGEEELCPEKAAVLGPVKVIPREYHFIDCSSIDIVLPSPGSSEEQRLIRQLSAQLTAGPWDEVMAFRGKHRWVQTFEPVKIEEPPKDSLRLRKQGVYLLTGGLGGMGLVLGKYLAQSVKARLILTDLALFPPKSDWQQWQVTHPPGDPVSIKIGKLRELEDLGAEILVVSADIADERQLGQVMAQANERFGPVNGVIHTAGIADGAIIQQRTRETFTGVLAPKVKGTLVLDRLLARDSKELDFVVFCSSLSTIAAPVGQVGYCAANAFLDVFAQYKNSRHPDNRTVFSTINWDTWKDVGMAVDAARQQPEAVKANIDYESALKTGLSASEGVEVFKRVLAAGWGNAAICTRDLNLLLEANKRVGKIHQQEEVSGDTSSIPKQNRPQLSTPYVTPRDKTEQQLAKIWQNFLALEKVGVNDNFFELGASSLDIVQVNNKIEHVFSRQLPVATLFTYPTIAALKTYLHQEESAPGFSGEETERLEKITSKQKNRLKQRKKSVLGEGM
jgi:NAD(P)-dependent dehydrogenase (short-subunit alcohol dehydrogenase family)/acyl carrier protein